MRTARTRTKAGTRVTTAKQRQKYHREQIKSREEKRKGEDEKEQENNVNYTTDENQSKLPYEWLTS